MEIIILVVSNVLLLGVSTAVLAGALLVTGEEINKDSLLKCLGINVVVQLVSAVPMIGAISGVIWIAALMSVFEKSFIEALLVAVVCWVMMIITIFGLAAVMAAVFGLATVAS